MRRSIVGRGIGSICATLLLGLLLVPGIAHAQYDAPPLPAAWALEDVTVVQADGRVQEGVTLVVRRGVIESIGPDVQAPADARRITWDEGTLWIYPGFVDAHGNASTSFPTPDREGVDTWNPTREVQNFTASRRAADHLDRGGEGLASQRRAGYVASVVYPGRGPIPGRPSLILHRMDARTPRDLVLDPSLGLVLAFQGAQGAYPGTLMAVQAFIRQSFLDAEHHRALRQAYGESPRDLEAPARDEDLEVLASAADGEIPVYFHASGAEGVRRVLALSDELGLRPVIVGGEGVGPMAEELARRNIPVLLTTDLRRPLEWDPESDEEPGPAAARERNDLLPVYETAGRLEAAGVRFALTSGGEGGTPLDGVRRYIEYGLSEEGALRALTLTPAELLGAPELVRIEEGMAAHFVVTDRDLFHEDAGIAWTFVNGMAERGRDPRGESVPAETGTPVGPDAVVGRWEGTIGAAQASFPVTLLFEMRDGELVGRSESQQGEQELTSVELDGSRLSFGMPGPMGTVRVSGEVADGEFSGSTTVSTPQGEFPLRFEFRRVSGGEVR
jgi:imidazolonepropionase-like amidohydrolase